MGKDVVTPPEGDLKDFLHKLVQALNQNFDHLDGQGAHFVRQLQDMENRLAEMEEFAGADEVPEHDHSGDDEGDSVVQPVDDHIADTSDAHDATAISNTPAGTIAATTVQAAIDELDADQQAHLGDTVDAHDATAISYAGSAGLAATTVEAALDELDSEKANLASAVMDGDAAGGDLGGTYPNPTVTDDSHAHGAGTAPGAAHPDLATHDGLGLATDAELAAHTGDTTDAHDASAVSLDSTTIEGTADDVQEWAEEVDNLLHDHDGRHEDGGADEIDLTGLSGIPAALTAHEGAANPHATYLTEAEADALYVELDQAEWTDLTDSGETTLHTHPGGGGSDGSDHDVLDHADANTTPAPSDGDVLTWDATPGEWVAAAAGAGAHPDLATHDGLGLATDAELAAHTGDATDAHDASAVSFDPTGLDIILGTEVQTALEELDQFTDGVATDLDIHIADVTAVHPAEAITIADAAGDFAATDVEGALAELQSDAETHAAAGDPHNGYALESVFGDSLGARLSKVGTALTVADPWPVGSIFISVVSTNPNTLLGYGTWAAFGAGRVLVGIDAGQTEFDTVEETGGAKTHTLDVSEIPDHTHQVQRSNATGTGANAARGANTNLSNMDTNSGAAGGTPGGGAHNNLQPYIVVYMWKRTA